jgi:hypothetical protein
MNAGAVYAGGVVVELVRSSNETWSFGGSLGASIGGSCGTSLGNSLGASLGGAFAMPTFSNDNTSFGGSAGGAATFSGKESKQGDIAGLAGEASKPGAS